MTKEQSWYVYILECSDRSYYCGVTTDLERRLNEHNNRASGARYTRARRPVELVYSEQMTSRSEACQREYFIKQLTRTQKQKLISIS